MEKLIEAAKKTGAEFEIYSYSREDSSVEFENAKLKDISSAMSSGVSLRLIKDGKIGFAYTKNLIDPKQLADNAMLSMKAGVEAKFSFPANTSSAELDTYNPETEKINNTAFLKECEDLKNYLAPKTKASIGVAAGKTISERRIINSAGSDLKVKSSDAATQCALGFPGGGAVFGVDQGKGFAPFHRKKADFLSEVYDVCSKEVRVSTGKYNVIFMPSTIYSLFWRLKSGASAESLYKKTTPLAEKEGEKIFSDILTIRNNPLDDSIPGARSFDDEGTPCCDFKLIDKGVFTSFFCDLEYAAKLGRKPTGHGFRGGQWGGDIISMKPAPALPHLCFDRGEKTLEQLVRDMKNGVIVFGLLGAHSGNIPNGDFSVGLAPAVVVENGKMVGKAKDAMMAGNIYDIMKRAVAVGKDADPVFANNPPVMFEGVSVAG